MPFHHSTGNLKQDNTTGPQGDKDLSIISTAITVPHLLKLKNTHTCVCQRYKDDISIFGTHSIDLEQCIKEYTLHGNIARQFYCLKIVLYALYHVSFKLY